MIISYRQKLSLPPDEKVPTKGIMKEYRNLQEVNSQIKEELKKQENKLVSLELSNRTFNTKIQKMAKILKKLGYSKDKVDRILQDSESDDCVPSENEEEQRM